MFANFTNCANGNRSSTRQRDRLGLRRPNLNKTRAVKLIRSLCQQWSWLSSAKFLATWKRTIVHKFCNITVLSCTKKTVVLIKNSSENSCPSSINGMQRARNEFWGEVAAWQKKQYRQYRGRSSCHQRGSDIVTSKCRLSASSNRYTDVYLLFKRRSTSSII